MRNNTKKVFVSLAAMAFATCTIAWEPTTHVYLAEIALQEAIANHTVTIYATDYVTGKILRAPNGDRIAIGTFEVDQNLLNVIQNNRPAYISGVCGPDAFPDLLTGQEMIHPAGKVTPGQGRMHSSDSSLPDVNQDLPNGHEGPGPDKWLQHIYNCAFYRTENGDTSYVKPENQAFAMGFLAHAAGDTFAHSFINNYTGGPFNLLNNGLKHVVMEKYIQSVTPTLLVQSDFDSVLVGDNARFIYDNMVRCDRQSYMFGMDLLEGSDFSKSLSLPFRFSRLKDKLQHELDSYPKDKVGQAAYEISHPFVYSYIKHWIADIDSGLKAWPQLSLDMSHALLLRRRVGIDANTPLNVTNNQQDWDENRQKREADEYLLKYATSHLISMCGAPDFVGSGLGKAIEYYGDVNKFIDSVLDLVGYTEIKTWIHEVKTGWVNTAVKMATGKSWDDWKMYAHDPATYFDGAMNTDTLNTDGGEKISRAALDVQMHLFDVAHTDGRSPVAGRRQNLLPGDVAFDWEEFAPAFNSVQMIKLTLLSPKGMSDLYAALNASSPNKLTPPQTNAMLGWTATLDGSNQWKINQNRMPLAVSDAWYRLMFMKQPGEAPFSTIDSFTTTLNNAAFATNSTTAIVNMQSKATEDTQVNLFAKTLDGGDMTANIGVPLYVTVPKEQTGTYLNIYTPPVTKPTQFEISALCGNYKVGTTIYAQPASLKYFAPIAVPPPATSGAQVNLGTASITQVAIVLDYAAPKGGATIQLSSSAPDQIKFDRDTVLIPEGESHASLTLVKGTAFTGDSTVTLTAHYRGYTDVTLTTPFKFQTGVSVTSLGTVQFATKVLVNRQTYAQSPISSVLNRGTNAGRASVPVGRSNFIHP